MNETVLITGSSRGLGRELALTFANRGNNIILHGRNADDLESVRSELLEKRVGVSIVEGDLRSRSTLDSLFNISREKRASVLVNNAGIHSYNLPFEEIEEDKIDEMLYTNLIAPIKLTWRIYPLFLSMGYGTIININSIIGLEPKEKKTLYTSSKWGLRGFSSSLRLESGRHNIKIIDVYPTRIKTKPEFDYGMSPGEVAEKIYAAYEKNKSMSLILDDRPEEFRQKHDLK